MTDRVPPTKAIILGCGPSAGIPEIGGENGLGDWGKCDPNNPKNRRRRCALYVEYQGLKLLVDAGFDIREQLIMHGITQLDALLITHRHADHISGLAELRGINRAIKGDLPMYLDQPTLDYLNNAMPYALKPLEEGAWYYRPALLPNVVRSTGEFSTEQGVKIQTLRLDHRVMDALGFRFGGLAYTPDVWDLPPETLPVLENLDTWIVDAYQYDPHGSHAHVEKTLKWVEKLKPRRTILTNLGKSLDYEELSEQLPDGVECGYDGLRLEI